MSRTRGKEPFYGYSGFWEVSVFVCVQSNADSNEKASHHARIAQLVEHQYEKCVTFPSPSCANSYVKRELIVVGSSPTPCNKLLSVVTKKEVQQTNVEYGFACLLFLAVCHYLDPDNLQYGENLVRRQP